MNYKVDISKLEKLLKLITTNNKVKLDQNSLIFEYLSLIDFKEAKICAEFEILFLNSIDLISQKSMYRGCDPKRAGVIHDSFVSIRNKLHSSLMAIDRCCDTQLELFDIYDDSKNFIEILKLRKQIYEVINKELYDLICTEKTENDFFKINKKSPEAPNNVFGYWLLSYITRQYLPAKISTSNIRIKKNLLNNKSPRLVNRNIFMMEALKLINIELNERSIFRKSKISSLKLNATWKDIEDNENKFKNLDDYIYHLKKNPPRSTLLSEKEKINNIKKLFMEEYTINTTPETL